MININTTDFCSEESTRIVITTAYVAVFSLAVFLLHSSLAYFTCSFHLFPCCHLSLSDIFVLCLLPIFSSLYHFQYHFHHLSVCLSVSLTLSLLLVFPPPRPCEVSTLSHLFLLLPPAKLARIFKRVGNKKHDMSFQPSTQVEAADEQLLLCPITLDIMVDPVIADDSFTYERESIVSWQRAHGTSPLTRQPISGTFVPNRLVKDFIARFLARQRQQQQTTSVRSPQTSRTDEHADIPATLRSIRPKVVAALDTLSSIAVSVDWQPPQIVVVGNESHGKSTMMERLLGFPVFPRAKQLCTRVAIRVQLRRGHRQLPTITTKKEQHQQQQQHSIDEDPPSSKRAKRQRQSSSNLSADIINQLTALETVRTLMSEMVAESRVEIVTDDEIIIRMQHPEYPEMDLVDLPGFVASARVGDDPGLPAATQALARQYMEAHGNHSMFLVVHSSHVPMNQSLAMQLISEYKLNHVCMGVLTKCDTLRPEDDDDEEETMLQDLLSPNSPGHVSLGYGLMLCASRPGKRSNNTTGRNGYMQQLLQMQEKESELFAEHNVNPQQCGIERLCQLICEKHEDYFRKQWAVGMMARIEAKKNECKKAIRRLGVPFQRSEDSDENLDGAVDEATLKKRLQKHVREFLTQEAQMDVRCEEWLVQCLETLCESGVMDVNGDGEGNRARRFIAARAQRRHLQTLGQKLTEAMARLQASLSGTHEVATSVVSDLVQASGKWKLKRFKSFLQQLKKDMSSVLSEWTKTCIVALERMNQLLNVVLEAEGAALQQTGLSGTPGADTTWQLGVAQLMCSRLDGEKLMESILLMCAAAFDDKVQTEFSSLPSLLDSNTVAVRDEFMAKRKKLFQTLQTLGRSEMKLSHLGVASRSLFEHHLAAAAQCRKEVKEKIRTVFENSCEDTLSLIGDKIGDTGCRALADALKSNTTLTSLDLSCNKIEDTGCHALAEALESNTTLTTLNLSGNEIEDTGCRKLAEALKSNTALTSLDVSSNRFSETAKSLLKRAARSSLTIRF
eukprot:m.251435 g.251435  ORF g.251435 m.251435 type:complete len:1015 (-) comp17184_c2_seq10:447-3491(-)